EARVRPACARRRSQHHSPREPDDQDERDRGCEMGADLRAQAHQDGRHCYSLLRTRAACVRAADRPGRAAMTLARSNADGMAMRMANTGTTGTDKTPTWSAKTLQVHLPTPIPTGKPTHA